MKKYFVFADVHSFYDELMELLSARVKKDRKKVEKDCERDHWMSAKEARNYGLIDEVL